MWGTFLQGHVGTLMLATYVLTIGKRTLYVRVLSGVRRYVDGHSHKTVLRILLKNRGPASERGRVSSAMAYHARSALLHALNDVH